MFDSWIFWTILWICAQLTFLQTFKAASRKTTGAGHLIVAVEIIGAVAIMALSPFVKWIWPSSSDAVLLWVLLAGSFVLFAVSDRISASTRKNLDISTDSMLHQTYRLLFFPIVYLVLGWTFNWSTLVGAFGIVIANMVLLFDKGKFQFNKWIWLKLLGCVFFTAAIVMQIRAAADFNIAFFAFLSLMIPAIILIVSRQTTPKALINEVRQQKWWLIVICGIALAMEVFLFAGINGAHFFPRKYNPQANAMFAAYVLLNVIFAFLFLKERKHLVAKSIAAVAIVACLVIIALKPF